MRIVICLMLLGALSPARADDWLNAAKTKTLKTFTGDSEMKKADLEKDRRGKVVIRRLKPQNKSDWNTDPTALPYFFYQLRQRTEGKFPAYLDNEGLEIGSKEIFEYPVIYFTSHYEFTFSDDEVANLKKYLARGGTLLLDDCSGSGAFTGAAPSNVQRIIPGAKMELMLVESKDYRDLFNLVYHLKELPPAGRSQFRQPFQVALLNGRPAIMLCPNDYGCAWEVSTPPTALNPLGGNAHGPDTPTTNKHRELRYQLSINWFFYALTH
ncbi:MAG: hypothetical protein ACI8W8_004786 [Rhodothermales bacterium]|jgi:hypothetical protein